MHNPFFRIVLLAMAGAAFMTGVVYTAPMPAAQRAAAAAIGPPATLFITATPIATTTPTAPAMTAPTGTATVSVTPSVPTLTASPFVTAPPQMHKPGLLRKVIVFAQGVCTSLDSGSDVQDATFGALRNLLKTKPYGYSDADFLDYSYRGGYIDAQGRWYHHAYSAFDPIRQDPRTTSVGALYDDLLRPYHAAHPQTTFVIVGHSLGGVVALEELAQNAGAVAYRNDFVSTVLTIDSPLHGVRPVELLLGEFLERYSRIGHGLDCVTQGGAARFLAALHTDRKTAATLARIVTRAHQHGVTVITAGNTDDCVWAPEKCGAPALGDARTQWIEAATVRTQVFTLPRPCLKPTRPCFLGTHGAALSSRDGLTALRTLAEDIGPQHQAASGGS